jgi:hypothetical protein
MNTTNKNIKFKLQKKNFSENFIKLYNKQFDKEKKIKYIFNKSDIKNINIKSKDKKNKLLNIKDKIYKDLLNSDPKKNKESTTVEIILQNSKITKKIKCKIFLIGVEIKYEDTNNSSWIWPWVYQSSMKNIKISNINIISQLYQYGIYHQIKELYTTHLRYISSNENNLKTIKKYVKEGFITTPIIRNILSSIYCSDSNIIQPFIIKVPSLQKNTIFNFLVCPCNLN